MIFFTNLLFISLFHSFVSSNLWLIPSNLFVCQLLSSLALFRFLYIVEFFVNLLTVFLHASSKFTEHLYNHSLELFTG